MLDLMNKAVPNFLKLLSSRSQPGSQTTSSDAQTTHHSCRPWWRPLLRPSWLSYLLWVVTIKITLASKHLVFWNYTYRKDILTNKLTTCRIYIVDFCQISILLSKILSWPSNTKDALKRSPLQTNGYSRIKIFQTTPEHVREPQLIIRPHLGEGNLVKEGEEER